MVKENSSLLFNLKFLENFMTNFGNTGIYFKHLAQFIKKIVRNEKFRAIFLYKLNKAKFYEKSPSKVGENLKMLLLLFKILFVYL